MAAGMPVSFELVSSPWVHSILTFFSTDRGAHGACERGRDEKHAGAREEHRGEREIAHGNLGAGLADLFGGAAKQAQGQARECRTGGRC